MTKKNLGMICLLLTLCLGACTEKNAPNNYNEVSVITYTASEKLPETTSHHGLKIDAFNVSIASHTFSDGIGTITFNGNLTDIGYDAFFYCSNLISITIPNSVTSIGDYAFSGCSGLTSIVVENGNTTYDSRDNCNAIIETATNTLIIGCKETIIPNNVTSIGDYAFFCCSGLTSITIPNSVTSIGNLAFESCSSLTSITIPNSVTSIGDKAFFWSGLTSISIPSSVTSIGHEAFSLCTGLTSIVVDNGNTKYDSRDNCNAIIKTATNSLIAGCKETIIPNSVTSIGVSAFYGCSGLTSISIPNSVTSIGDSAFIGCTGLTSVTIGNSVTSIESYAFSGCRGLTSISIPSSVTSIGDYAFDGCSGLTSIVVDNGNTKYDSRDNCNAIIKTATNSLIAGCKETIIPNSVTSIESYAFDGCFGLTSITIPNSVTSIGDYAFGQCFWLTSVTCEAKTPPSCGSQVFSNLNAFLYVPKESITAYESTEVWQWFEIIQGIE